MAIGCGEQPEGELRKHKVRLIQPPIIAVGEQREPIADRRTAIGLIAEGVRQAQRLAEVLLGKPGDPSALPWPEAFLIDLGGIAADPASIKAFHNEGALLAESGHGDLGDREAERAKELGAQPLILD